MPGLTRSETLSVAATGALALIFIITAWWSFGRSPFVLAGCAFLSTSLTSDYAEPCLATGSATSRSPRGGVF
jgi:hypothetical protein